MSKQKVTLIISKRKDFKKQSPKKEQNSKSYKKQKDSKTRKKVLKYVKVLRYKLRTKVTEKVTENKLSKWQKVIGKMPD